MQFHWRKPAQTMGLITTFKLVAALCLTLVCVSCTKDGPSACAEAGGRCVLGSFMSCAQRGPQDCNPDVNPGGAFCCLRESPQPAAAGTISQDQTTQVCTDANVRMLLSSDYDQSCKTNDDCVRIGEGNVCFQCVRYCKGGVISKAAEAQYLSDIADLARASDSDAPCHCPAIEPACCLEDHCQASQRCVLRPED